MFFRAVYIALHLAFAHGAPGALPVSTVVQATAQGVDPAILAGYLEVGHPGARYSGRCGDHGMTCGPFRLHRLWAYEFGVPLSAREGDWSSAWMASRLLVYAQERHEERCERGGRVEPDHGWRAHLKARSGRRGSPLAHKKVRRQLAAEKRMCPEPLCTLLRFAP